MKRYDEYKQTGTPWIGEIPSHWEVIRLKNLIFLSSGLTLTSEEISDEGEYPVFGGNGIRGFYKNFNFDGERILIGRVGALCGNIHYTKSKFWGTEHVLVSNRVPGCTIPFDYEWLSYLLDSMNLNQYGIGSAQPVIAASTLENLKIPVPPLSEQEAIAAYLDKKCGSIDAVISTQERRIALLEELKQSVITEAVTHGINPDAKLRPSGIDWIGNIPEHWEVMPLKYAANKKGCCFIDGDWIESKDIVEEGIKYITTGNIGALYYKEQGSGYISEKTFMSLACTEVFEGDILISRLNEPIGRSCIIPNLGNRVVTSVDNVIFRPDTDYYNKKFILYYLNCNKFTEHANLIARGATMHRISRSMLGHQKMLVPPLREQEEIVEYIDRKIKPIDASIAKAKREIELLKELKQSVITEAVTGKIKVC